MKFSLETTKTREEVLQILRDNTSPKRISIFSSSSGEKYFWGEINQNSFKIRRILWYNNSFQPIIRGNIVELTSGTRVEITMRPHLFILAFTVILLYFLFTTFEPLANGDYVPFVILTAFLLLAYAPYRIECLIAKKKLVSLLSE
ncbi:MAG: hypothetical protein K6G73_07940 [Marinilabiliaceae bacterium]|nr:hypothetical protein [Marinilabiliaceae bacterium]